LDLLKENERISVFDLNKLVVLNEPFLMIDVRKKVEYDMCHLPFSINIQLNDLKKEEIFNELMKKIISFGCTTPNCKYKFLWFIINIVIKLWYVM